MPIRINLLAEAQATDELRRRDPVKRAIYVASCLVVMVLVWASSLQVKILADKARLTSQESRRDLKTNEYAQVQNNQEKLFEVNEKLGALNRLAVNRFLNGTMMDSLMHSTVDGIQITKLRTEQGYEVLAEIKPVKDEGRIVNPGRKAGSVERDKLVLNARDASANPGDTQINVFRDTLAHTPYFLAQQITTNNILLRDLSAPQLDADTGKPYVNFTLECTYPEHAR
jgi:hypothetical protein